MWSMMSKKRQFIKRDLCILAGALLLFAGLVVGCGRAAEKAGKVAESAGTSESLEEEQDMEGQRREEALPEEGPAEELGAIAQDGIGESGNAYAYSGKAPEGKGEDGESIAAEEAEKSGRTEKEEEKIKEEEMEHQIDKKLKEMTLDEKVAQLFVIFPEALVGGGSRVTAAGEMTRKALDETPVGGIVYVSQNLQSKEQVQKMLGNLQNYSMDRIGLPLLLCADEEGGTVTRVAKNGAFGVDNVGDMCDMGADGDVERAYAAGEYMGEYLSELGLNVDFAPVADVLSNPENQVVKKRSFGSEPEVVSDMAVAVAKGLESQNVISTYKHFPGHGATAGDTHEGYAYTDKTLDELKACELIPFQEGIDNGIPMIMIGHISLPNVTGDNTPASLSKTVITDLLREEMGYDGVVITDALNMGAIVQEYSSSQACVKAIQAGADILLMPEDFHAAYQGVIAAVKDGTLSEARIDESAARILRMKMTISKG